jgi:hypothetical protein
MAKKKVRTASAAKARAGKKKSTGKSAGGKKTARKASAVKKGTKKKKRASGKRELIDTGRDKRYVRRDAQGQFNESDDVGRSLSMDRRRKAKKKARSGYGDKGD